MGKVKSAIVFESTLTVEEIKVVVSIPYGKGKVREISRCQWHNEGINPLWER